MAVENIIVNKKWVLILVVHISDSLTFTLELHLYFLLLQSNHIEKSDVQVKVNIIRIFKKKNVIFLNKFEYLQERKLFDIFNSLKIKELG